MINEANKEKIRNEYVHGYVNDNNQRVMPTLGFLIKKYNMRSATIYRMSTKENWKQQKINFSKELHEKLDLIKMNQIKSKMGASMTNKSTYVSDYFNVSVNVEIADKFDKPISSFTKIIETDNDSFGVINDLDVDLYGHISCQFQKINLGKLKEKDNAS
tara:strand:+ start:3904 stop:4380 length:477 start_codon:yes stop_codon:yes gene_type:complete